MDTMNQDFGFGYAINCLKNGHKVARKGWNGKGMYVELKHLAPVGNNVVIEPFLVIKNVKGTFNTWVPSISDLFAEDWYLL